MSRRASLPRALRSSRDCLSQRSGGPQRQEKGTDGRRNTQGPGGTQVSRLTGWEWEGEPGKMINVDTVRLPPK